MLSRRNFLTTIAAAPLAKFCKTEPVRPWNRPMLVNRPSTEVVAHIAQRMEAAMRERFQDLEYRFERVVEPKAVVERRYNLPRGTLG